MTEVDLIDAGELGVPFLRATHADTNPAAATTAQATTDAIILPSSTQQPGLVLKAGGAIVGHTDSTLTLCHHSFGGSFTEATQRCLLALAPHIQLKPTAATLVLRYPPLSAGRVGAEEVAAAIAAQGVLWVRARVLLRRSCLTPPSVAAATVSGMEHDEASDTSEYPPATDTYAHGRHVLSLLRAAAQPPSLAYGVEIDPTGGEGDGAGARVPVIDLTAIDDDEVLEQLGGETAGVQPPPSERSDGDWFPEGHSTAAGHSLHDEVFDIVRPVGWTVERPDPPGLKSRLYRYQRRALAWMVWREGGGSSEQQHGAPEAAPPGWPTDERNRLLWSPLRLPGGRVLWACEEHGLLSEALPEAAPPPLRGGLLCDEMGLGKTVEVIALMLAQPATLAEDAPANASDAPPTPCRATLIVTPPNILQQWVGEIEAHSNLKVFVYGGLHASTTRAQRDHEAAVRTAERGTKRAEKQLLKAERELMAFRQAHPGVSLLGSEGSEGPGSSQEQGGSPQGLSALKKQLSKLQSTTEAAEKRYADAVTAVTAAAKLEQDVSPVAAAAKAVREMASADVVLTTYGVLGSEVSFDAQASSARALRQPKRYQVPDSPLVQLQWHRLVLDEAQMSGTGLTAVARMAHRVKAERRWCVTGTPMGAGGLQDLFGTMAALKYEPLDNLGVFRRLVVSPYLSGSPDGYQRLRLLLKPIMWRNSKLVAAGDVRLPPRSLRNALLALHTGERTFYEHISAEARKANVELKELQAELEGSQQGFGATSSKKRDVLARRAVQQLTQLRLACVHPQLTEYWRQLSAELQLGQGQAGVVSMSEMVGRLRDQAQLHLQNEERDYCVAADLLAAKLLAQADALDPETPGTGGGTKRKRKAGPKARPPPKALRMSEHGGAGRSAGQPGSAPSDSGESGESDGEAGEGKAAAAAAEAGAVSEPQSVPDVTMATPDGIEADDSPAAKARALRQEALELLESSYLVGEKGIDAVAAPQLGARGGPLGKPGLEERGSEDLGDGGSDVGEDGTGAGDAALFSDISAASASWRAWRLVQVRTCHLLSGLYTRLGRPEDAARLVAEQQAKAEELAENADLNMGKVLLLQLPELKLG